MGSVFGSTNSPLTSSLKLTSSQTSPTSSETSQMTIPSSCTVTLAFFHSGLAEATSSSGLLFPPIFILTEHGMAWYGLVNHSMSQYGVVRYGMVWCGVDGGRCSLRAMDGSSGWMAPVAKQLNHIAANVMCQIQMLCIRCKCYASGTNVMLRYKCQA